MTTYEPPVDDLLSSMRTSGVDVDADVGFIVSEFARFALEVIAPTDRVGDREGVLYDADQAEVRVPPAIASAYRAYVEGGWPAAGVEARHGGGTLPYVARLALEEILCSSNLALSLNPMLTRGAIELLGHWGSEDQKARLLPRLVSGEWTATMNLTEPDAGSDVGALRARAVPAGDGWRLTGTKIFITWGEHDLASNIVHMVLARTPGAPPGTKGISLFAVPKLRADGSRNSVWCRGVEHKLGIHGSPTCVIEFDGADAELVGPLSGGMAAMFTMMNAARLAIAVQGVAIGQLCLDQASHYAQVRRQGVAVGTEIGPARIIEHPDVRRMVLDIRSTTRAMRLLVHRVGAHVDSSPSSRAGDQRDVTAAALLTPVAKAWCTDQGTRLASVAVQVLGGAGYVEESGAAQRYRDSRIGPIYEGTNGIQAIDLAQRKVRRDDGAAIAELLDEIERWASAPRVPELDRWASMLSGAVESCRAATGWLCDPRTSTVDVLAGATAYLDLVGTTLGGALLGRHACAVADRGAPADEAVVDADFFATEHLPRTTALLVTATAGAARLGDPHTVLGAVSAPVGR